MPKGKRNIYDFGTGENTIIVVAKANGSRVGKPSKTINILGMAQKETLAFIEDAVMKELAKRSPPVAPIQEPIPEGDKNDKTT